MDDAAVSWLSSLSSCGGSEHEAGEAMDALALNTPDEIGSLVPNETRSARKRRRVTNSAASSREDIVIQQGHSPALPCHEHAADSIAEAVLIETREEMEGRVLVARRSFASQEEIFSEAAFLLSRSNPLDALRHFSKLKTMDQERYFAFHNDEAHPFSKRIAEELHGLNALGSLSVPEATRVLSVWELNAFALGDTSDRRALFERMRLIQHGCAPNILIRVDGKAYGKVIAARDIAQGEVLYTWYPEDVDLYWMAMPARREALSALRAFTCGCTRCLNPIDSCRILRCPKCHEEYLQLTSKRLWTCSACHQLVELSTLTKLLNDEEVLSIRAQKFHSAMFVSREEALAPSLDVLSLFFKEAVDTLGSKHWLSAWNHFALHHRATDPGEAFLHGLAFLDWFTSRELPVAPSYVLRNVLGVAWHCYEYLGASCSEGMMLRARLLDRCAQLHGPHACTHEGMRIAFEEAAAGICAECKVSTGQFSAELGVVVCRGMECVIAATKCRRTATCSPPQATLVDLARML